MTDVLDETPELVDPDPSVEDAVPPDDEAPSDEPEPMTAGGEPDPTPGADA